jgi:hypothetical protein
MTIRGKGGRHSSTASGAGGVEHFLRLMRRCYGRWKFRSADQAIRAGDCQHPEIAGAMELGLVRRYRRFRSSLIVPEGRVQRPGGGGSGELVAAPGQPPLKSWGLSWLAKEIIRRRDARTYNSRTKPEPVIEPTPNPASDPPPQMPGDPVA